MTEDGDKGNRAKGNIRGRSYASALFKLFDDSATDEVVGEKKVRLWRGGILEATKEVGIPDGSYKRIMDLLERIGSIQVLQRGARGYPSFIALLTPPTDDLFLHTPERLTRAEESARLTESAKNFIQQLGGIDIGTALVNHEERLKALEAQFSKLEREGASAKKQKKVTTAG